MVPYYPRGLGEAELRRLLPEAFGKTVPWVQAYIACLCEQLRWRGVRRDEFGPVWHVVIGTWVPRRMHMQIRTALVEAGVLEFTDYRRPDLADRVKGECRGYRFTVRYRAMHWLPMSIHSTELRRLRATPSADWQRHKRKEEEQLKPIHHTLRDLCSQIVLTGKGAKSTLPIARYLTDQDERRYSVDWQNRAYHPVVLCDRHLRKYLRVRGQEGQPLWSADLRAFQVMLLTLVLSGRYTLHPDDYRGEVVGHSKRTRGQEEGEIVDIVAHCGGVGSSDAFSLLQLIGNRGDPYERVLTVMNRGLPEGVSVSRNEGKRAVLCVLFGRPGAMWHQEAGKALKEVYPGLYDATHYAASRLKPGALARIMQRVESRILIGRVATRIVAELPGVVFATMHDGILAQERHIYQIAEIMNQEVYGEVQAEPCVKVESTNGTSADETQARTTRKKKRKKKSKSWPPSRRWAGSHGATSPV